MQVSCNFYCSLHSGALAEYFPAGSDLGDHISKVWSLRIFGGQSLITIMGRSIYQLWYWSADKLIRKSIDHSQWIVCIAFSNLPYWSVFLVTSYGRSVKASLISADSIRQCIWPLSQTTLRNTKYFNYIGISYEAIFSRKQKASIVCSLAGSLRPPIQGEPQSGSLVQTDSLGLFSHQPKLNTAVC